MNTDFYQKTLKLLFMRYDEQIQKVNNLLEQRPELKAQLEPKLSERTILQATVDQKLQSAPATPATATPGVPSLSVGKDPNPVTPTAFPPTFMAGENPQQTQSGNSNVTLLGGVVNGGGMMSNFTAPAGAGAHKHILHKLQ